MSEKIFSTALSHEKDGKKAIKELTEKVRKDLNGNTCSVAIIFVSESYQDPESKELIKELSRLLPAEHVLACNSSGVIGDESEVEMAPAIALIAMYLPNVKILPISFLPHEIEHIDSGNELVKYFDIYPTDNPKFICLADPLSCDVTQLLNIFNEGYPECPVIGGLASGVVVGAKNWIYLDGDLMDQGAAVLAMTGDVEFEMSVSQGCRPVGEPMIITKAESNVVQELSGKPALQMLGVMFEKLSPGDQALAKSSLFVGIVMDENQQNFKRGDFLIRNIMGVDYEKKAILIGELVEPGQTLQFQLRDARTAEEDLEYSLGEVNSKINKDNATAGILVSCCGRGKGLFGSADHDINMIQSLCGPVAVAGFFANGEFGQINKVNYIHGYTSSLTFIR